eukprot:TRINITY_DN7605_c0_g1_i1.p1 TRINITY_DN7605_c0_g1~~TRINITY_DN7605_c0_g1_i1.p1  ORF type:complete len:376 (+),score=55.38 TRINITY_DN7605_c0_g1_i1:45-1130(+)
MTVVVTGTTRGYGAVVAQELMLRGYSVLCTGRGPDARNIHSEMVNDAEKELEFRRDGFKDRTGFDPEIVEDLPEKLSFGFADLDIADKDSIKEFTSYMKANTAGGPIYLINNAAESAKGWTDINVQKCMDTNFWGTVRLTESLIPIMPEGSRIFHVLCSSMKPRRGGYLPVGVCSDLHDVSRTYSGNLPGFFQKIKKDYSHAFTGKSMEGLEHSPYALSKSCLYLYALIQSELLKSSRSIHVNGICPGILDTNLALYPAAGRNPYNSAYLVHEFLEFENVPTYNAKLWYRYNREYPNGRLITATGMRSLEANIDPYSPEGETKAADKVSSYQLQPDDWRVKFIQQRQREQSLFGRFKNMFS